MKNEVNPIEATYENSGLLDLMVKRLKRNAVTTMERWTFFEDRIGLTYSLNGYLADLILCNSLNKTLTI